jgi:hypothetical protein
MMNLKLKLLFTVLTVGIFTFIACNKEISTGSKETSSSNIQPVERYKFRKNIAPVDDLIARGDKESLIINKAEYELSKVLVKLAVDKKFTDFVIQTSKQNKGVVKYSQIFEQFPQYMRYFQNTILEKRFNLNGNSLKMLNTRNGQNYDFEHTGYGYESVIFVANYENDINSNYPVVAPELEIEDDEINENYDIVYAMEVQGDGTYEEVNVGQYDASQTTSAIMVTSLVTIAELNASPIQEGTFENLKSNDTPLGTRSTPFCQSNTFTIKVYYDQSCSQEIYAAGTEYIAPPLLNPNPLRARIGDNSGENQSFVNNWRVVSMKANECGKPLFVWFGGSGCSSSARITPVRYAKDFYKIKPSSASSAHFVYYNLYERDWYCANKTLGTLSLPNGEADFFEGRRRYHDEWFAFNPGTLDGGTQGTLTTLRNTRFPTGTMHTSGQTTHNFDNGKGSLFFKRIDR